MSSTLGKHVGIGGDTEEGGQRGGKRAARLNKYIDKYVGTMPRPPLRAQAPNDRSGGKFHMHLHTHRHRPGSALRRAT